MFLLLVEIGAHGEFVVAVLGERYFFMLLLFVFMLP